MPKENDIPTAPAGWYTSPGQPHMLQWFDGTVWVDRFERKPSTRRARVRGLIARFLAVGVVAAIAITVLALRPGL